MKNRILLVGNEKFTREAYVSGEYFVLPKKKYVETLYDEYDVENLSNTLLTSDKAFDLVSCFIQEKEYDMCVIAFGKAEMLKNSPSQFEFNLQRIINMLLSNGVVPVLLDIEADATDDVSGYNKVINKLKKLNNAESKFYGDCLKIALV